MFFPLLKVALTLALICCSLGTFVVWLLPADLLQNWAYQRAATDDFARYEAIGMAEALWWTLRIVLPMLVVATLFAILQFNALSSLLTAAFREFRAVTSTGPASGDWRGIGIRIFIAFWLLLAVVRAGYGYIDRTRDWTYFRWNNGETVLPNISDSNREVIQFLQAATPPDAKILVLSDQKLFFLSYYLLPRRLIHPMHADAEFVIPLANQARQLPAYRLSDLSQEQLNRWKPDYILEYFEGPDYVGQSPRDADQSWLKFWRMSTGSSGVPSYLVSLKKVSAEATP